MWHHPCTVGPIEKKRKEKKRKEKKRKGYAVRRSISEAWGRPMLPCLGPVYALLQSKTQGSVPKNSSCMAYHVLPHGLPLIDKAQAFTALPFLHSQLAGAYRRLGPFPLLLLCFLSLHT